MKIFCYKFKENITLKSNYSLNENTHSRNKIHHSLNHLKKCPYKMLNKLKNKILKIIRKVYKTKTQNHYCPKCFLKLYEKYQ
jgi:hypothetical protein